MLARLVTAAVAIALGCSLSCGSDDSDVEPAITTSNVGGAAGAGGAGGMAVGCPSYDDGSERGRTQSSPIAELSGIGASRVNADALWVHNDSGGQPQIFAIDTSAQLLATFDLVGAYADDWEDIAVGRGPDPTKSYIFVGDIGDNFEDRLGIVAYRIEEPLVTPQPMPYTDQVTAVDTLLLSYADGPHNAEALMVDPIDGALYIVTKADDGLSRVFQAPAPHDTSGVNVLSEVGSLQFGAPPLDGTPKVTAGDISVDGSMILLRTYDDMYLWRRQQGQNIAEALTTAPCRVSIRPEIQGEAVGFAADGSGYYTASENEGADPNRPEPLWFFAEML